MKINCLIARQVILRLSFLELEPTRGTVTFANFSCEVKPFPSEPIYTQASTNKVNEYPLDRALNPRIIGAVDLYMLQTEFQSKGVSTYTPQQSL